MSNEMTCRGIQYVIRQGDSLYKISRIYRVPLALLLKANPYVDVYNLQVGDEICIPLTPQPVNMPSQNERPGSMPEGQPGNVSGIWPGNMPGGRPENRPVEMPDNESDDMEEEMMIYVVQNGDTLEALLDRFELSLEELLRYNRLSSMMLQPGSTLEIPQSSMEERRD